MIERTYGFIYGKHRNLNGQDVTDYLLINESQKDSLPEDAKKGIKPVKLPMYDDHFIQHIGDEYCVKPSCNGCQFTSTCHHISERIDISGLPNIRRALISRDGYSLAAIDYSGIELRVAANIANEDVWIEAFLNGKDIHEETAKAIFKESVVENFKFKRQLAKCVTGETLVKIKFNSGTVIELPIESLFVGIDLEPDTFLPAPTNLMVLNEYGDAKRVNELYYGGEQDTVRVDLENGSSIEGSFAHRIRVIDEQGAYVWKHLDEISDEDVVVTLC